MPKVGKWKVSTNKQFQPQFFRINRTTVSAVPARKHHDLMTFLQLDELTLFYLSKQQRRRVLG